MKASAKKSAPSTKELKKVESETALAAPVAGGLIVKDEEQGSLVLGRLAMYSGTSTEQELYAGCNFAIGDFIDVLERRKIASPKIVPVWAGKTWVKWPQGAKVPEYVYTSKRDVPAHDLVFEAGKPPACSETWNVIVLVDGEPFPYKMIFKRTSFRAGQTLVDLEGRRGARNAGRGCYALGSVSDKNTAGQVYRKPTVTPAGDCPATLVPLLNKVVAELARLEAAATAAEEEAVTSVSDEIPI